MTKDTKKNNSHIIELERKIYKLMEEKEISIRDYTNNIYSKDVHRHIFKESRYLLGLTNRNIMLPVDSNNWFNQDIKNYYSEDKIWPNQSYFQYSMDFLTDRCKLGLLYFGYSLCNEVLVPSAFFVVFRNTWKVDDLILPEEWVVDPMALNAGKKPDCYIGFPADIPLVEKWLLSEFSFEDMMKNQLAKENKIKEEESNWHREILMSQQEMLSNVSNENKERVISWLCSNV